MRQLLRRLLATDGRISDLANATLTPLVDVVNKKLDSLSNDELRKILDDYKLKLLKILKRYRNSNFMRCLYL